MTWQIAFLLTVLVLATLVLISEKVRPDLVALSVMLILGITRLITPQQAFAGLSSSSVILILAVFIMTGALFRTGVSTFIGRWLVRAAGDNPVRMVTLIMFASAGLSLFMNNIASAAVLMPAAMDASRRTKISPAKLLLPMALAVQLGGMATVFTTANIVASAILQDNGLPGFGLGDFLSTGGVAALAGIAYMVFVGYRYLPAHNPMAELQERTRARANLAQIYGLGERLYTARLEPDSSLIGRTLRQAGIGERLGLTVTALERNGKLVPLPSGAETLRKNDVLLFEGREERAVQLGAWGTKVEPAVQRLGSLASTGVELIEALVAPRATVIGKTLKQMRFRTKTGLNVIALWRADRAYRRDVGEIELQAGDGLLIQGQRSKIEELRRDGDWILLRVDEGEKIQPQKMLIALGILGVALAIAATGWLPVALVMFTGALAMVLTGCLGMEEAYQAIDWRSVFLVGGMLSVGVALSATGAAQLLAQTLTGVVGQSGPLPIIAALFLLTTLLNQFIPGGSAVPALLTPIAIASAIHIGADPRAFALVIAIATGTSMLTPFAHPVNVLVMGPGGYHFGDYFRAGLPLVILTFLTLLITLPIFWHVSMH